MAPLVPSHRSTRGKNKGIGEVGRIRPLWTALASHTSGPSQISSPYSVIPIDKFTWVKSPPVQLPPDPVARRGRKNKVEELLLADIRDQSKLSYAHDFDLADASITNGRGETTTKERTGFGK